MKNLSIKSDIEDIVKDNLYESADTIISNVKSYLQNLKDNKTIVDFITEDTVDGNTLSLKTGIRIDADDGYSFFTIIAGSAK